MLLLSFGAAPLPRVKIQILNNSYSLAELWKLGRPILRTLSSPRKLWNLARVAVAKRLRLVRTWGTPVHCYVEASSFCNLRCPMCMKLQKGFEFEDQNMSLEQFRGIMDQVGPNALTLRFWNFGEPTLNPRLCDMIDYASGYRVFTVVSTNGLTITPALADRIVASRLDFLIVSFDGGLKESYEYNRRNGNFEKFIACMENLAGARRRNPGRGPFVAVQFVCQENNFGEWAIVEQLTQKWGFDKLMIRRLMQDQARSGTAQGRAAPPPDRTNFCSNFWQEIVFNATGVVVPCCMDAGPEVPLGNIYEKDLDAVWNGPMYQETRRKALRDLESIPICSYSCYKRNNQLVFED